MSCSICVEHCRERSARLPTACRVGAAQRGRPLSAALACVLSASRIRLETTPKMSLKSREAHWRYTAEINRREGWSGCLWQGRVALYVMDDRYTLAAARYAERCGDLNPVRAGLVARPGDYPWSSARAHLLGRDDCLVKVSPLLARVGDWTSFLGESTTPEDSDSLRKHETTGSPLGAESFVDEVESALGRVLRPRTPGPAPRPGPDEIG